MAGEGPCRDFYIFFIVFLFSLEAKLICPLPGCEFFKNDFLGIYQLNFDLIIMGGGGSVFLEIVFFPMVEEGPCRDFYSSFL